MNDTAVREAEGSRDALGDPSLEALPVAVATFDLSLRLVSANGRFLSLCHEPRVKGAGLAQLLVQEGPATIVPQSGERLEILARDASGQSVVVTLARAGHVVGAHARHATDAAAIESPGRLPLALLALSREVALSGSEEQLMAGIARAVRELFPGCFFCVRIVDPRTFALTSVYAEGKLLAGPREVLTLRRGSILKAHVNPDELPAERVRLLEDAPLIFAGSARGFATPLAAAGQFFGVLNLEYPPGRASDLPGDERVLIQLANQAAVGVRNAKLIDELTFVKKYLEELIENANALILVVNREGKIIVFNRALSQLCGHSQAEILGTSLRSLVADGDRSRLSEVVVRSLAGEKVSDFETRLVCRKGTEVKVSFCTATVLSPSGEVEGVIAIGQDLTRQKELEKRVIQAEKLASLGQLAAGVVHEINNPLTTITIYTDALLQKHAVIPYEAADVDKLQRIHESAGRILKFARDLTSYARPSNDRPDLVDVHRLLDQAVGYCEHAVKHASAVVTRRYADGLPSIRGMRANLVQVFINLVTNACHSLAPEGGKVDIETRLDDDGALEIAISDTGSGIEAHHLPRIFEPFFTTKAEGAGTGLGLSIVQGIVEKHGGTIRVTSELGHGTCFTVSLPNRTG